MKPIKFTTVGLLTLALAAAISSCGGESPTVDAPADQAEGTLTVRANGEDFVRQGFTSKDGWAIEFDHVYVTLANVTAYQSDPPFDPQVEQEISAKATVAASEPTTVDLAEGDESAEPVKVADLKAPAGRYNALSWELVPAPSGPAQGYPLVLQGTATKDGQSIPFTLKLAEELTFTCGDFVGDERKGILEGDNRADLEATFHFDHLFGDGDAPPEDEINTGALGFDPIAALATDGRVDLDSQQLQTQLAPADYQTLLEILPSLGHVGEGHCEETKLTT